MDPKKLFEILAREHAGMLAAFLRSCVRDPGAADDLFQDTLLVAWRNLDRFDPARPFGPWLRGIAGKLVLAHRRKAPDSVLVGENDMLDALETRYARLADQPGDTWDEKLDGLRDCLAKLPTDYRSAVDRHYVDGLKGQSLAEQLGIGMETAKKRLQRARHLLAECLNRKLGITEGA